MRQTVNTASLLALRAIQRPGAPDAVTRIIVRFLQETDERVAELARVARVGDAQALERVAHALKGIAGTVGADEILRLAVQLEQIGCTGLVDGAVDLVTELEAAVDRARPIFDRLREDL